jgi:hypothetical protein
MVFLAISDSTAGVAVAAFADRVFGCMMDTAVLAVVMEIGRWPGGGGGELGRAKDGEASVGRGQVEKVGGLLRRIGRLGRSGRLDRSGRAAATGGSLIVAGRTDNSAGRPRQRCGLATDGSRIAAHVETVTWAITAPTHLRDRDLLDMDRGTTGLEIREARRIHGRLWRAGHEEIRRASDQNAGRLLGAGLRTGSLRGAIHPGSTGFRRTGPSRSIILRLKLRKRISRNRTAEGIRRVGMGGRNRIAAESMA